MRKCTFNFIGMLCALLLFVACASSRRTISNVSSETMDSLSLSTSDSLMYSEVQQGSTSVVKSDSSSTKQNISESGSDEEIVTNILLKSLMRVAITFLVGRVALSGEHLMF